MILPIALIFVALSAAAAVAFGTHPAWAGLDHGLEVILWSRRLQWPLVGVSMAACVGLIALSVTNRKRAWWLIGLVPVLAMFAQRFVIAPADDPTVAENPTFVEIDQATFIKPEDWVVALKVGDRAYAYPYACLFVEPAVVQNDHDKRLALFWNAQANRVLAFYATAEFRGRDLDVVSSPAHSLLVYNAKFGQFICGVTGLTPDRKQPTGLAAAIPTIKLTFAKWKAANPTGTVMQPNSRIAAMNPAPPTKPIVLADDMTPPSSQPATKPADAPIRHRRVAIVGSAQPLAVDAGSLGLKPAAVNAGDLPAILVRTDAAGHAFRAFARKLDDLELRFEAKKDAKLQDVRMADTETGSLWSAAGVAIGGTPQFRGRRLQSLPVDADVDYEVMKWWMPELEVYAETPTEPKSTSNRVVPANMPSTRPTKRPAKKKAAKAARTSKRAD